MWLENEIVKIKALMQASQAICSYWMSICELGSWVKRINLCIDDICEMCTDDICAPMEYIAWMKHATMMIMRNVHRWVCELHVLLLSWIDHNPYALANIEY